MSKEGWPDFPFFWIKKPRMSSLRDLAEWLHQKTELNPREHGFTGDPTPMEKQIIEHLIRLEQQVGAVTDVVQGSLQIIDDQRPSQKATRAFNWARKKGRIYKQRLQESTFLLILSLLGALVFVATVVKFLLRLFKI